MAIKMMTREEFVNKLRQLFDDDHDLCRQFTSAAIGENGSFEEYDFFDADEFFEIFCQDKKFTEILDCMSWGWALEKGTSPADPYADYFRWDGNTIDSTDNPEEFIYTDALDDIIDYILENAIDSEEDYDWYPDEIKECIEEYKDNGGDI